MITNRRRLTHPDALTHSDAVSINRTCVHARAHTYSIYTELRRSASVRQTSSGQAGEEMGQTLEELANRVRRLVPSHRDPEAFHEAKSEIEAELRQLARTMPADPCAPRGPRGGGSSPLARPTGPAEREIWPDEPVLVAKVTGLRKG